MKLRVPDILLLCSFPVLMAVGQLLFRKSAHIIGNVGLTGMFGSLARAPLFYFAIALYGAATFLWVWLLSRYPLAIAYPFAMLAVIIVPLLEAYLFKQTLSASYWIGLLLILSGVMIVARSAPAA